MRRMSGALKFLRDNSESIQHVHILFGATAGAFLGAVHVIQKNGSLIDAIFPCVVGTLMGYFPPMLWGVGGAMIFCVATGRLPNQKDGEKKSKD
jgi:hypothetical protein